ncbi:hypothetical protein P9G84_31805 [Brevibacillus centrosporus]|uniref:hypothetical protein n=1 Tax=Brevibacillus centrosporus TaxID=54910 RepID=UPI001144F4B6|nr:hypothetical protein [Brevibacillus centrosporus]MEC2133441.1 hypothetical protein [Brevibacillus centrosporus]GED34091.1 hypothetical protein BCE02nite_52320 [Brevibacillus centrosporus]
MENKEKDYPTWELGGLIKKAEVITYILSVIEKDLPVTGMEIVRLAKEINWSISVTHVYKILKKLEIHDPDRERYPILSSRWLDDGCRERLYDIVPSTGPAFLRHAHQTMVDRCIQVQHLIRNVENHIRQDSSVAPAPLLDSFELLSVRDLYRLSILSYSQAGMSIKNQIKTKVLGLRINKAHYRLQAAWLSSNGYQDSVTERLTTSGEEHLLQIKSDILAQIPHAKQRVQDLLDYPSTYQKARMRKQFQETFSG